MRLIGPPRFVGAALAAKGLSPEATTPVSYSRNWVSPNSASSAESGSPEGTGSDPNNSVAAPGASVGNNSVANGFGPGCGMS